MSYQVLARKWRPRIFREMVGQEHVLKALINALDHNRLHHAYLFTGTRGVGKTTIARILAKCLNCESGVSSEPCGKCSACTEIAEGRFVDLIEVDAASRTKVEDTRELLDNVQYAPTRGRYKIYLIDEVHMLSNHSFNALLKTLEEPPEHVKFLLATTDPQKLPVTILSRCLQFNLKNLSAERIVGHLQDVLTQEVIPFEEAGLWQLARSADGSMRDALSLTDQSIAFGGGKVLEADVSTMLGSIDHVLINDIVSALLTHDGKSILQAVAKFADHAPDYDSALADLIALFHRIAIAQALPEALDNSYGDKEQVLGFAASLAAEDVQLYYQMALLGRRDLALATEARIGFEMTLLRMLAFKPQGVADVPSATLQANPAPSAQIEQTAPPASPVQEGSEKKSSTESGGSQGLSSSLLSELSGMQKAPVATPATQEPTRSAQPQPNVANAPADESVAAAEPVKQPQRAPWEEAPATPVESMPAAAPSPEAIEPSSPPANTTDIAARLKQQVSDIVGHEGLTAPPRKDVAEQGSQDAPTVSSVPAAVEAQPIAQAGENTKHEKIALEELSADNWVHVYHQLNVKGIVQSTASNTVLVGREANQVHFILNQDNATLFDVSHSQRMSDMMSDYFGEPIRVDIHVDAIPEGRETPAQYDARERAEEKARALIEIKQDPVIQTLEQEFSAHLIEDSVKYIKPD